MAMRGYDRDEYENLDEYEEEYEDQEDEEVGEDEYEEEAHQPTEQELEYLELRQRLKESIRKQMKKDSGSSLANSREKTNKLPYNNFGSFFGPSQPVIAQRVLEESKSLLENPQLAERVFKSKHSNNKIHTSIPAGSKPRLNGHPPKVTNARKTQTKVQMLKNTRDYSFLLSDDAEPPASKKDQPSRNVSVSRPEARSAQQPLKSKQLSSNNGKKVLNARDELRAVPASRQMQPKVGPQRLSSASKPTASVDYHKQHGSNSGSGPGRPQAPKGVPSKVAITSTEKKILPPSAKNSMPVMRKPLISKPQSSIPKQTLERRREMQESSKGSFSSRQPVSSKPQIKQPLAKVPSRVTSQQSGPKKRPARKYGDDEDEDGEAISIIRKMFGYNPRKYDNEDDVSDMEANFEDIQREERRSAIIAQKEDEEELRKIEEEERREQLRREAKKRKLNR